MELPTIEQARQLGIERSLLGRSGHRGRVVAEKGNILTQGVVPNVSTACYGGFEP